MTQVLTAAQARALLGGKKAPSVPHNRTNAPPPTKDTKAPVARPEKPEKEPAEKHVQLPPAPAVVGPWAIGQWTARRSVAYEPDARVMLVGPADEFDKLLAHLQAFKP